MLLPVSWLWQVCCGTGNNASGRPRLSVLWCCVALCMRVAIALEELLRWSLRSIPARSTDNAMLAGAGLCLCMYREGESARYADKGEIPFLHTLRKWPLPIIDRPTTIRSPEHMCTMYRVRRVVLWAIARPAHWAILASAAVLCLEPWALCLLLDIWTSQRDGRGSAVVWSCCLSCCMQMIWFCQVPAGRSWWLCCK